MSEKTTSFKESLDFGGFLIKIKIIETIQKKVKKPHPVIRA